MGDYPASVSEHIDVLDALIETALDSLSGSDPVAAAPVRGRLGGWRLERFELRPELDDLLAAIDDLEAANAVLGSDPAAVLRHFQLGRAYGYLAGSSCQLVHVEQAIAAFERARGGEPHAEVPPEDLIVCLAELYADRHALMEQSRETIEELVAALTDLVGCTLPNDHGSYLRMLLGSALLARHEIGGRAGDLSRGIELLTASISELPGPVGRVSDASVDLVHGLRLRFHEEGDRDDLEQALHISSYMSLRVAPDDPNGLRLRMMHSMLAYELWTRERDRHDLDCAVISARMAVDEAQRAELADLVMDTTERLAGYLIERGEQTGNVADLAEAARLYDLVCATLPSDREDRWLPLLNAAVARFEHWDHTQSADLPILINRLDAAIEAGIPDSSLCLAAQSIRYRAFAVLRDEDYDRARHGPRIRAMIEEAERSLARCRDTDLEVRAILAGQAAISWFWLGYANPYDVEPARVKALLDLARQLPEPPAVWHQILALVAGLLGAVESGRTLGASGGAFGGPALASGLEIVDGDPSLREVLVDALALTRVIQATSRGDLDVLDAAAHVLRVGADGKVRRLSADDEATAELVRMTVLLGRDDYIGARDAADAALRAWAQVPDDERTAAPRRFVALVRSMLGSMAGEPASFGGAEPDPVLRVLQQAARAATGSGSVAELLSAVQAVPAEHALRGELAGLLAHTLVQVLARSGPDHVDIDSAIAWSTEAHDRLGGPHHPMWSHVSIALANAYRLRGMRRDDHRDLDRSRDVALDALRGHVWLVLLQSGTEHAMIAGRNAAAQAYDVAAWCLADSLVAHGTSRKRRILTQLLRALDAGRGLVLHAATTTQQTADRLSSLGHDSLAAAWRDHLNRTAPSDAVTSLALSTGDVPYQALRALLDAGADMAAELMDPPAPDEIASALRAAGADALVYLVAGQAPVPGYAAIVAAAGDIDVISLDALQVDAGPLIDFIHAHREMITSAEDEPARAWRGALDQVCRWAWTAAMADILARLRVPARDRVSRLVLIPVGTLAIVPWAAAWRDTSGGRRYVVQDVVLSQAASARQLCDTVARGHVAFGDALVVGDPDGTLPAAGVEARAIHAIFYPSGRYLGQPPGHGDGDGTADELLAWLKDTKAARDILHIACHGVVEPQRPTTSFLRLAGGQELAVGDVIATSRSAKAQLGTVVLAACATNVSGEYHDEALSLANAFLAAGARSVVASLWVVPDVNTGLFMFMLHHHLRARPDNPAGALRRTQLWMLDPARVAPPTMPTRMRARVGRRSMQDLGAWSAFVHVGAPAH